MSIVPDAQSTMKSQVIFLNNNDDFKGLPPSKFNE